jgi:hypothetical protein
LEERLKLNGIDADPCNVASAWLGLASDNEWNKRPDQFAEWLEQLAMDVLCIRKEPF